MKRAPVIDRFLRHIDMIPLCGCWIWTGSLGSSGYGKIRMPNRTDRMTHRFAYETFVGPIPNGMQVLHRCDVKPCCNPDHLFLGTQTQNIADMYSKGRGLEGAKHPGAKLTAEAVAAIRSSAKSQMQLATQHGVSRALIRHVLSGAQWKRIIKEKNL